MKLRFVALIVNIHELIGTFIIWCCYKVILISYSWVIYD